MMSNADLRGLYSGKERAFDYPPAEVKPTNYKKAYIATTASSSNDTSLNGRPPINTNPVMTNNSSKDQIFSMFEKRLPESF